MENLVVGSEYVSIFRMCRECQQVVLAGLIAVGVICLEGAGIDYVDYLLSGENSFRTFMSSSYLALASAS